MTNIETKYKIIHMKTANVGEAKARFSALIHAAEAGETVIIARDGEPVVQMTRAFSAKRREFGGDDGLGYIADDFDAPLPDEVLASFYGGTPPKTR